MSVKKKVGLMWVHTPSSSSSSFPAPVCSSLSRRHCHRRSWAATGRGRSGAEQRGGKLTGDGSVSNAHAVPPAVGGCSAGGDNPHQCSLLQIMLLAASNAIVTTTARAATAPRKNGRPRGGRHAGGRGWLREGQCPPWRQRWRARHRGSRRWGGTCGSRRCCIGPTTSVAGPSPTVESGSSARWTASSSAATGMPPRISSSGGHRRTPPLLPTGHRPSPRRHCRISVTGVAPGGPVAARVLLRPPPSPTPSYRPGFLLQPVALVGGHRSHRPPSHRPDLAASLLHPFTTYAGRAHHREDRGGGER